MEFKINKEIINLTVKDLQDATVLFSFFEGRKFEIKISDEATIQVSLQTLQKSMNIKNANLNELKEFYTQFTHMREQGYEGSDHYELQNANLFVRITAAILHCFSERTYTKLLSKLEKASEPAEYCKKTLTRWNNKFDKILHTYKEDPKKLRENLMKHRVDLYTETQKRAEEGYYLDDGEFCTLDPDVTQRMIEGTKRFPAEDFDISSIPNPMHHTVYEFLDKDTLDLAESYIEEGLKPAALNLANASIPGGWVEHGSGAQEESIFRRSNYYQASRPDMYPIHGAEAIYTPSVQIFRTGEKNYLKDDAPASYQYRRPFEVDFIACAGIDLRGMDEPPANLEEITRAKIHLILSIAVEKGHDSLVLGALGCGAFKNDPQKIAAYFKEALDSPDFKGRFKKVGFGIIFNENLRSTFEAPFLPLMSPKVAD